jgi:hypothetical protein
MNDWRKGLQAGIEFRVAVVRSEELIPEDADI